MAAEWIPPHPAQPQVIVRPCDLGFGLFAGRPFAAEEHILVFTGPELSFESMVARGEAEANALQMALKATPRGPSFIEIRDY